MPILVAGITSPLSPSPSPGRFSSAMGDELVSSSPHWTGFNVLHVPFSARGVLGLKGGRKPGADIDIEDEDPSPLSLSLSLPFPLLLLLVLLPFPGGVAAAAA